jgi:transposase
MRPALFVRAFASGEQQLLEDTLRSSDGFALRRAHYLLASSRGLKPQEIAATYGGCEQTVRNVVRAFNASGPDCLIAGSHRPKTIVTVLADNQLDRLEHLLHQSPRLFGKDRSTWTQQLLAEVCYEQGLTEQPISDETVRRALKRLGAHWKRAKHWITSPDPAYTLKKSGANVS